MKKSKLLIAVFCLMIFAVADTASASTIAINPDKTISIDGKKTFMVGLYSVCIDEGTGGIMKECDLSNKGDFILDVSGYPPSILFDNTKMYWTTRASTPLTSQTTKPKFFGYVGLDEPKDTQLSQVIADYNKVKSYDAAHPVILNHFKDLHKWYQYTDILTWDTYMIRNGYYGGGVPGFTRADGVYAYETHSKVGAFNTIELNAIPKPVWAVLQANGNDMPSDGLIVPTPKEIKATTYSALAMDVKGISFWSYHIRQNKQTLYDIGLYGNPTLFTYYQQLARELRSFNDILVSPTIAYSWYGHRDNKSILIQPNPVKAVEGRSIDRFSYNLKKVGNTYYLFLVNKDSTPISDVSITIPGISGTGTATTLGLETTGTQKAGRNITTTNGNFIDSFDGYAAHIYKICSGTSCNNPNPAPMCSDGIQNQGETGIDCGGPCAACSTSSNQLTLKPGWNQISSPVAAGISLATIESSCTILPYKNQKLWAWNATSQIWTNPTKVEPFKGYWIYTAYQCTVPLSGTQATFSSLQLYNGWNKISASGALSAIAGTCSGHIIGNWIWHWDKATEKWSHPTAMQMDKGYWINVDQNCVIVG